MKLTYATDRGLSEIWHKIKHALRTPIISYAIHDDNLFYEEPLCITEPFHCLVLEEVHQPPFCGP